MGFPLRSTAIARAGPSIPHIPSFSPQARGRSERLNRTLQDRLVNELRVGSIDTLETANRYLAERFIPAHNATFARPPRDPESAFVPLQGFDLDQVLCHEEERVVAKDNTVALLGVCLQIEKQPARRTWRRTARSRASPSERTVQCLVGAAVRRQLRQDREARESCGTCRSCGRRERTRRPQGPWTPP